jgi:DDE family transposase
LALVRQLQAAFPPDLRWSLVADRGFPSAALFAQLRAGGTDFSVRLRLSDWVCVARVYAKVTDHLAAGRLRVGHRMAATVGNGQPAHPQVSGWVVVSAAVAAPPPHKQNPGTRRERLARSRRHARHRQHKRGRKTTPPSALAQRYAQTWVLFTTAPTKTQAVRAYAGRMTIEETYRDWHHHWAVRTATVSLPTAAMVSRLIGVVCLAYTLQMLIGWQVSRSPEAHRRRAQWTVSGRVSWFWCGQRIFTDPGYDWSAWLAQQWVSLGQLSDPAPASPLSEPVFALAA